MGPVLIQPINRFVFVLFLLLLETILSENALGEIWLVCSLPNTSYSCFLFPPRDDSDWATDRPKRQPYIFTMVLFDFIDHDDIQRQRRLRQVLLMELLLQFHNNIRDRHILNRSAIVQPIESPWKRLYERGDDESFFRLTGLNRRAFRMILEYIFDLDEFTCRRRGRPCLLGPDGYLGLVLFYMGSTMTNKHLCLIIGTTPSVCSRAINWMLKKIVRALTDHPFARVKIPDRER